MTVLVDGRVFSGRATGIQRVARGLVDGARAVGADLCVVAPRPSSDPRVDRQLRVPRGRVWEQLVLPALARRRTVLSLANTAPLAARSSVVFVHDIAPIHEPAWFVPRMRWYARAVAAAARGADRVLVPSAAIGRELEDVLGIPAARIVVARPAVAPTPVAPEQVEQVRRGLGLSRPYAVLVGWADPRKDLATALAAHRRVREQVAHDLVLVGSPQRNLAPVPLPQDESVRALGPVDDATLRAVLAGAQVLLHPSVYEGFGLPPLEAWACGTPALVGDVPAVRESTCGLVEPLPLRDVAAWAEALEVALTTTLPVPELPGWTWEDAGRQLLVALS